MNSTEKKDGRWYIIHTYSGQEDRVKKNLEQRIETMDVRDRIFEVIVPTENEIQIREGKRRAIPKKIVPGYILVRMAMDDDSWYVVRNTSGVTGFISTEDEKDKRLRPVPLEDQEIEAILRQIESETPRLEVGFSTGESVRIKDGPFADFMGTVDEVQADRGKVTILVSFFGRDTPVELDFLQVEKLD